jgi:hypothetical protein
MWFCNTSPLKSVTGPLSNLRSKDVAEHSVFAVKGAGLCQLLLSNGFYPWQGWNPYVMH